MSASGIGNLNGPIKLPQSISLALPETIAAKFVERKNRFVGLVELDGQIHAAHVPSSGRMRELLFPGNTVYITPMPPGKRTSHRILLAAYGKTLVSVDALLPNRLIYRAVASNILAQFTGYDDIIKEVGYGTSRIDLFLKGEAGRCFMEIKSVTLVDEGVAKFPDAPSERGTRHLIELAGAVTEGFRAAVIFLVQRDDAVYFTPNQVTDPAFAQALRQAVAAGVEVYALTCQVTREAVTLWGQIPVHL